MKKKITALCLCVALLAIAVVGASLAFFTDTKSEKNTFTVGNVQIKLDETDITKTDGSRTEKGNDYGSMYPGRSVTKDPTVHNVGANSAYIRAKVTLTGGFNLLAQLFPNMEFENETPFVDMYAQYFTALVGDLGEDWSIVDIDGDEAGNPIFVFKYAKVLDKGEDTPAIFEKLTIPSDYTGKDANGGIYQAANVDMTIVAEAMQAEGFDTWEKAFEAYDKQA